MDIEKYRTFTTAADSASFSEAAERLFLSTSTVTKHISALERDMGVMLFDRLPEGTRLTDAGSARLALASQIVSCYDELCSMNTDRGLRIYSIPCLEKNGSAGISYRFFGRQTRFVRFAYRAPRRAAF